MSLVFDNSTQKAQQTFTASTTPTALTLPTVATGDLIQICIMQDRTSNGLNLPSGGVGAYTAIYAANNYNVYWKIAGASEPNPTVASTGSTFECIAVITCITGADPVAPINVSAEGTASGGSNWTTQDITTTVDNCIKFAGGGTDGGTSDWLSGDEPASITMIEQAAGTSMWLGLGFRTLGAAGATGTETPWENQQVSKKRFTWAVAPAGGSSYTLTAETRGHTLTGQTTETHFNRLLAADTRSHSLAGQSVNALFNRALIADSQSYSLAGQSATLLSNKLMVAASASFTLAGQPNALVYARVLVADTQSYSFTGQDATLTYSPIGGYIMAADGASFSLSANDAGLRAGRVLPADSSALSLSGQPASLLSGKVMTTNTGAYSLTGNSASLLSFKVLSASTSSYILTGQPADFGYISGGFMQFPASVVRAEEDYSITLEPDNSVKIEEDYLVRVWYGI